MEIVFTIIVPVYKIEESLLRDCLNSLKKQEYKNVEFIIVDDGSPDNCGSICDEYGKADNRFIILHTENKGVSNARNVGLDIARGKYIIFVDGDDYVESDLCLSLNKVVEKYEQDILFFYHCSTNHPIHSSSFDGNRFVIEDDVLGELPIDVIKQKDSLPGIWTGAPWGKVFLKETIEKNDLRFVAGLKKSQDRVFVFDYLRHAKTAAVYNYLGYHYVSNENSICHRYNENIVQILEMAGKEFEKRIIANNKEYQRALNTMYLIFMCEYILLNFYNKNNPDKLSDKITKIKNLVKVEKYNSALKYGDMGCVSRTRKLMLTLLKLKMYYTSYFVSQIIF